jgi:hypothetical protein
MEKKTKKKSQQVAVEDQDSSSLRAVAPPESVFLKLPRMVIETRVHTLDYHPEYGHVTVNDYPVSKTGAKSSKGIMKSLEKQGRKVKSITKLDTFKYSGFLLTTHLDAETGKLFKVMHEVKDEDLIRFVDENGNDGLIMPRCTNTSDLWHQYY